MTPAEKLAQALEVLHQLQQKGITGIYTDDIKSRQIRERLVKNRFLKEVSKGWYIASDPKEQAGDSTSWYASYWEFCGRYLDHKFGDQYCLSPEQSLQLHTGNRSVPAQLIVRSPQANNSQTPFPFNTSMFNYRADLPARELMVKESGLWLYRMPAAMIYCPAAYYNQNPIDSRAGLGMIRDASELLAILLNNGNTTLAGRLAGAFRNIGKDRIADNIIEAMRAAEYDVREDDPFEVKIPFEFKREFSPFVIRIKLMWQEMREKVIQAFPAAPGLPEDRNAYMKLVDEVYVTDAYHSLSIERYKVSPELIERVRSGKWDKDGSDDKGHQDAMAARGYYLTFQEVKTSIQHILEGANPGNVAAQDHSKWYRSLFEPSVSAGLLKPSDLAGYRSHQVYIGGAKHVPLSVEAMRDVMPVLFELLEEEPEASVRAVLGHFIFVFIHPYENGNGRMGRFLMNIMLASGGYPWTVIPVERRLEYMKALESASVNRDIGPFAGLIAELVGKSLNGRPEANLDYAHHE
jgi:hypothetical protein